MRKQETKKKNIEKTGRGWGDKKRANNPSGLQERDKGEKKREKGSKGQEKCWRGAKTKVTE